MTDKPHRLALVLSGGGVRAAAHIGLLRALGERGLEPTAVSGASAGSLVAALYACGISLDDMLHLFRTTDLFSWSYLGFATKPGLLDSAALMRILEKSFEDKTYADVDVELHIVATDLLSGEEYYFRDGPISQAVMASAAFPGVISPVSVGERLYADGGIINNFPLEPLVGRCEVLIGSHVNPVAAVKVADLQTTLAVSQRSFQIATAQSIETKLKRCDFGIAPQALLEIGLFELHRTDEAYEIGYDAACEFIDEVARRLK